MKFSNLILTLFFSLIFIGNILGQTQRNKQLIEKNNWLTSVESDLTVNNFFKKKFLDFGLQNPESIRQTKIIDGEKGLKHFKFQQYYKNLKVLGGEYVLHEQNGKLKNANGLILPHISLNVQSKISNAGFESIIQDHVLKAAMKKNQDSFPKDFHFKEIEIEPLELVIADKSFPEVSGEYVLVQIMEVELPVFPPQRDHYLIDVNSRKILSVIPQICHFEVEGRVKTRYSGEQTITVDSVAPDRFLLQDFTRGNGIITLNDFTNAPFEDTDNYWNNVNERQDEVAGDAHFGAISFYDYLLEKFNWNGLDNEGKELISVIHQNKGESIINASWNGNNASFGDGNCGDYGPLTSLEVVGHEFAHGLTDFTSNLTLRGEPGGINEGMSDIFGKALEYYFGVSGTFNWEQGASFITGPGVEPFRSMQDPNLYEHPKLYRGAFWDFDNIDPHNRGCVLGHWFYLIVEGGQGTNEIGVNYEVTPIGMDKAMEIVFATQTGYLTSTSNYPSTAGATIAAAEALFGPDSPEVKSVKEAWKAVGVTHNPRNLKNDLGIELWSDPFLDKQLMRCNQDEEIPIRIRISNLGSEVVKEGTVIDVVFEVEAGGTQALLLNNGFELSKDLPLGGFEDFEFDQTFKAADYNDAIFIYVKAKFPPPYWDEYVDNNSTMSLYVDVNEPTETEISLFVKGTPESVCNPQGIEIFNIIRNRGCEIIKADTPFELTYYFQNNTYTFSGTIPNDLENFESYQPYNSIPINTMLPLTPIEATIVLEGQAVSYQDELELTESIQPLFTEDFSNFDDRSGSAEIYISGRTWEPITYQGNEVLAFTGSSIEPFEFVPKNCTDDEKIFESLKRNGSTMILCIDASNTPSPYLSFEMTQFVADSIADLYDKKEGAQVRVRFEEGSGILPVIIKGQQQGEKVEHEFQLPSNFFGNIDIEVVTLTGNGYSVSEPPIWDFIMIDNLTLGEGLVNITSIDQTNNFEVYPNPANETIWFENKVSGNQEFNIEVFNSTGSCVKRMRQINGIGQMDISNFSSGVYFYKIDLNNGEFITGKVMVD